MRGDCYQVIPAFYSQTRDFFSLLFSAYTKNRLDAVK